MNYKSSKTEESLGWISISYKRVQPVKADWLIQRRQKCQAFWNHKRHRQVFISIREYQIYQNLGVYQGFVHYRYQHCSLIIWSFPCRTAQCIVLILISLLAYALLILQNTAMYKWSYFCEFYELSHRPQWHYCGINDCKLI